MFSVCARSVGRQGGGGGDVQGGAAGPGEDQVFCLPIYSHLSNSNSIDFVFPRNNIITTITATKTKSTQRSLTWQGATVDMFKKQLFSWIHIQS